jgi:Flp pilus assembly protein TadB
VGRTSSNKSKAKVTTDLEKRQHHQQQQQWKQEEELESELLRFSLSFSRCSALSKFAVFIIIISLTVLCLTVCIARLVILYV